MTTHQELWQHARTLADLGNLTAEWLEGAIGYAPAHGPDDEGLIRPARETAPLIPYLARANRNGFVTCVSQPGVGPTGDHSQRAFVDGFCDGPTAGRIHRACRGTDLVVIETPPAWENPTRITVTMRGGKPCTWAGGVNTAVDIAVHYGEDCPRAVASLFLASQVVIIDPVWGRQGLLWETLDTAWAGAADGRVATRIGAAEFCKVHLNIS